MVTPAAAVWGSPPVERAMPSRIAEQRSSIGRHSPFSAATPHCTRAGGSEGQGSAGGGGGWGGWKGGGLNIRCCYRHGDRIANIQKFDLSPATGLGLAPQAVTPLSTATPRSQVCSPVGQSAIRTRRSQNRRLPGTNPQERPNRRKKTLDLQGL